jgi:hypothetical protein
VTENLIRQEARRTSDDRVRSLDRAVRVARVADLAAYQRLLDDFREDVADQVAALAVLRADGTVLASTGAAMLPSFDDARRGDVRNAGLLPVDVGGEPALVTVVPCRCVPAVVFGRSDASDRGFVQIAILRTSLSAPFARLRRNAIVSASGAIALLLAIGLIGVRVGPYVRGKQLESQLGLARQVQRALLPSSAAWPVGVDAAAACVPASQVGGDFYDVHELPDGRLAFSIGDVSGHGISAALLMSMMHGALDNDAARTSDGPDQTMTRLNTLLLKKSSGERFASMISCVYDPAAQQLHYVNAGHPPALLMQRDEPGGERITRLGEGGPVLGVLHDAVYQQTSVPTREGDLLVLFSDGIVEAVNAQDNYFGEGRLLETIARHRHESAEAISRAILQAVQGFSGRHPVADDRTVVIVRLWHRAGERTAAA